MSKYLERNINFLGDFKNRNGQKPFQWLEEEFTLDPETNVYKKIGTLSLPINTFYDYDQNKENDQQFKIWTVFSYPFYLGKPIPIEGNLIKSSHFYKDWVKYTKHCILTTNESSPYFALQKHKEQFYDLRRKVIENPDHLLKDGLGVEEAQASKHFILSSFTSNNHLAKTE